MAQSQSPSGSGFSSSRVVLSVTLGGWMISAVCGRADHWPAVFTDGGGNAVIRAGPTGGTEIIGGA